MWKILIAHDAFIACPGDVTLSWRKRAGGAPVRHCQKRFQSSRLKMWRLCFPDGRPGHGIMIDVHLEEGKSRVAGGPAMLSDGVLTCAR